MCDNPSDSFMIHDIETLRVASDPIRSQIIEMLVQEPQTVKQVADKLGDSPKKLYYHFNLLEKHGLICVAETRQVANLLEKIYKAAARYINVEPSLLSFSTDEGKAAVKTYIEPIVDTTREDLMRSLQARFFQLEHGAEQHTRSMFVYRQVAHIRDERALEFIERLEALFKDFVEANDPDPASPTSEYALMSAFYPRFYYDETASELLATEAEPEERIQNDERGNDPL